MSLTLYLTWIPAFAGMTFLLRISRGVRQPSDDVATPAISVFASLFAFSTCGAWPDPVICAPIVSSPRRRGSIFQIPPASSPLDSRFRGNDISSLNITSLPNANASCGGRGDLNDQGVRFLISLRSLWNQTQFHQRFHHQRKLRCFL